MAKEGERVLWHAVRLRVALRYVGELGLVLGLAAFVPAAGAAVFGEYALILPYAVVGGLLVGLGALARRAPAPRELQRNEALVITTAAFVLGPVVMSAPLGFHGIPWLDALFEAVSGLTTTGLTTLASVEGQPRTFLLARAWLQWLGGLGFVVLSLALTAEPGIAMSRLGAPPPEAADVVGSVRAHARRVLVIYVTLTALGVAALLLLGADGFDAVAHTLAGVSTGGFAPRDTSLARLGPQLQVAVLLTSLLGAVSLPLYAELRRGRWRRLRDDVEVRALVVAVFLAAALLVTAARGIPSGPGPAVRDLALLAVSAQTTAGFSTLPAEELPTVAKALLIASMITGGSVGSTAGGIKLLRVLIAVRLVQWLVARTRLPAHAVSAPTLAGARLERAELQRSASLILLFLAVLGVSWLPFLAYGYAPIDALFEVASATGTVGLSVGIARPELEPVLKVLLCLNMLLGRLEIFAVLVALSPRTWIGRRAP